MIILINLITLYRLWPHKGFGNSTYLFLPLLLLRLALAGLLIDLLMGLHHGVFFHIMCGDPEEAGVCYKTKLQRGTILEK